MPVAGALAGEERGLVHGTTDTGPGSGSGAGSEGTPCPGQPGIPAYPTAGRATTPGPAGHRVDVLWWAYPLVGPGTGRHLVLATDAGRPAAGTGARCAETGRRTPMRKRARVPSRRCRRYWTNDWGKQPPWNTCARYAPRTSRSPSTTEQPMRRAASERFVGTASIHPSVRS